MGAEGDFACGDVCGRHCSGQEGTSCALLAGTGSGVGGENSGLRQTLCLNHVQWEKSLEELRRAARLGGQLNGPRC